MSICPLAGLVLAGGQSRRMGMDKAILPIPVQRQRWSSHGENGSADRTQNFLEYSYALAASLASPVWVACKREHPRPGFPVIFDAFPDCGPGSGILAGLKAARELQLPALLVLACDLPLLEPFLLKRLIQAWFTARANSGKPLVSLYSRLTEGRNLSSPFWDLEMLVAVYSVECAPMLEQALKRGERALWRIFPLERLLVHRLEGHAAQGLYNCNYPDDLAKLESLHKKS